MTLNGSMNTIGFITYIKQVLAPSFIGALDPLRIKFTTGRTFG